MPPTIPPPKRGTRRSPYATWSHFCSLGRQFDQVDSDHEDAMDSELAPLFARAAA